MKCQPLCYAGFHAQHGNVWVRGKAQGGSSWTAEANPTTPVPLTAVGAGQLGGCGQRVRSKKEINKCPPPSPS
jgi:hypothetical protein